MRLATMGRAGAAVLAFCLMNSAGAAQAADSVRSGGPPTKLGSPAERAKSKVFFGDLHLHTAFSFDAYLFKTTATPDDAYDFAQGKPLKSPNGGTVTIDRPLDFLAVTDHSENMGVMRASADPSSPLYNTPLAQQARDPDPQVSGGAFKTIIAAAKSGKVASLFDPALSKSAVEDAWAREIAAANRAYKPGKFTSLIAYEWSSMPETKNLHRNVIFRAAAAPLPFTSIDSDRPEELWKWLETQRKQGYGVLAIPHNSNMSDGAMFDTVDSDGKPFTKAYAEARRRNEPAVEVTQLKGASETNPVLSPNDEFADFEIVNERVGSGITVTKFHGGYVRDAYRAGLTMQETQGFDPYKFGLVGASDSHAALTPTRADRYNGAHGMVDAIAQMRLSCAFCKGANDTRRFGNMGLTAVWAPENTREQIFDGIVRRETYATSGPRMKVRFFGGADLSAVAPGKSGWVEAAYRKGVPMGGDLALKKRAKPQFVVWALKDPDGANLDRVQIVKVWSRNGQNAEQVIDVAWSGARKPDPKTGKVPAVGNTVDVANAAYTNTIGATELKGKWTDKAFDPKAPTAYYVRVLEIPTPRWSTYDAKNTKMPIPAGIPASVQQRAYTSPIWYDVPGQ
jgi:hypothetical protein